MGGYTPKPSAPPKRFVKMSRQVSSSNLLTACYAVFKANLKIVFTYRGMIILHIIRLVMLPMVIAMAWLSIEKTPTNPYSNSDYLLYYLLVPIISNITNSRAVFKFPTTVRDGTLSKDLIKPYPPLLNIVIETVSHNLQMLIYLVPFVGIFMLALGSSINMPELTLQLVLLTLVAAFVGAAVRMLISGAIALAGFWLEDVTTLNLVLNGGIWALLGGMIVPVATFPEKLRRMAELLPYRYMLSFPIEIFSGHLSNAEILKGFLVMLFWITLFGIICKIIWHRGLKTYSAYGG